MTAPGNDLTVLGAVQETQANAAALGLQWGLRPATVSSANFNDDIQVVMDGDTQAIPAISLIGAVYADSRVWVLQIPPSGNYIVGAPYLSGSRSSGVSGGNSTNSATYVATSSSHGVVFVAPASGSVDISIRASTAPAATAAAWMSVRIASGNSIGSGTEFQAASDSYALMLSGAVSSDMGTSFQITGLTPGVTYNAQLQHRTTAGTSFWSRREVIIAPT